MCEESIRNRGNLRTSMSKKEACKELRDRNRPGNCKECRIRYCDYNKSIKKVRYVSDEE